MAERSATAGSRRWAAWTTAALSLAGLGVSAYLTYVHYTEPRALSCPDNGAISCTKVTTSPESMVFGVIPVAVLGVVFFTAMLALCLPMSWRAREPWVDRARLAGVVAGMGMVLYLVAVELLSVHAICLWCTGVHVVAFALFVVVLAAWTAPTAGRNA